MSIHYSSLIINVFISLQTTTNPMIRRNNREAIHATSTLSVSQGGPHGKVLPGKEVRKRESLCTDEQATVAKVCEKEHKEDVRLSKDFNYFENCQWTNEREGPGPQTTRGGAPATRSRRQRNQEQERSRRK